MRARLLTALTIISTAGLAASSCVIGSPPGFGDGDVWTLPLVGPLEDDVLLVPVSVNDKGPYLFLIDPDSNVSTIDKALVSDLQLYSGRGGEETTEADNRIPTFYAEVPKIEVGNLVVRSRRWRIHKVGTYVVGGRRVRGVLGRDIIADSLIFAVDRDRGIAQLSEQGKISPPAGASKIGFSRVSGRKLATVTINGQSKMKMHLDLGGRFSRLWPEKLKAANLPNVNIKARLVDEYGTVMGVTQGAIAASLQAGGEAVQGLLLVAFGDKRLDKHDVDGSLGQDFFARFQVHANWHKKGVWISRRAADLHSTAATRIGRWDAIFGGCESTGCVKVSLGAGGTAPGGFGVVPKRAEPDSKMLRDPTLFADPAVPPSPEDNEIPAPASEPKAESPSPTPAKPTLGPSGTAPIPPPVQSPRFRVERDANSPELAAKQRIEVLLDAVNADGVSMGLPRIQVTLRAGENLVEGQLDSTYAGASNLVLLDVTPLGRTCAAGQKCIWIQTKRF